METLLAYVTGILVAVSVYMLLRRHLLQVFFGMILLSNAVNLILFSAGRLTRGRPPLIPEGEQALIDPSANPLTQALILTAIVIGFGLLAYLLVLIYRTWETVDKLDSDELVRAETHFDDADAPRRAAPPEESS